jgi:hypothetical protein
LPSKQKLKSRGLGIPVPLGRGGYQIGDKSFHTGDTDQQTGGGYPAALTVARRVHRCRALQDKFAVVVACTLGFPEFIGFGIRVFLKVGASVGV